MKCICEISPAIFLFTWQFNIFVLLFVKYYLLLAIGNPKIYFQKVLYLSRPKTIQMDNSFVTLPPATSSFLLTVWVVNTQTNMIQGCGKLQIVVPDDTKDHSSISWLYHVHFSPVENLTLNLKQNAKLRLQIKEMLFYSSEVLTSHSSLLIQTEISFVSHAFWYWRDRQRFFLSLMYCLGNGFEVLSASNYKDYLNNILSSPALITLLCLQFLQLRTRLNGTGLM